MTTPLAPRLISADIGLHGIAWAVWNDRHLVSCGYTPNPAPEGQRRTPAAWAGLARATVAQIDAATPQEAYTATYPAPATLSGLGGAPTGLYAHLVVETPQVYARSASAVDSADLLQLQAIAACLTFAHPGTSSTVLPADWKGQTPKAIHQPRIWKRLELCGGADLVRSVAATIPARRVNDLLDAVGIGLVFTGLWKLFLDEPGWRDTGVVGDEEDAVQSLPPLRNR